MTDRQLAINNCELNSYHDTSKLEAWMNPINSQHRSPKTWHKVSITAPAERAEIVSSFLASIPVDGIEQLAPPPGQAPPATEKIIAYLSDSPAYHQQLDIILDFIQQLNRQLPAHKQTLCDTEPVIEQDWNSNWKKHFKPFKLSGQIVIKPSWEPYTAKKHEMVIEMDPGMAFGTGLHASTRLALLLIEQLFASQVPAGVLDVGTGTGILGMSCALLGTDNVLGLDNDIDAICAARENIARNHLPIHISAVPLNEITGHYDLVTANITSDILIGLAGALTNRLAPGGSLILSGILAGAQAANIRDIFTSYNLAVIQTKQQGEWAAIHFKVI